jgi:hypothetical protein
MIVNWKDIPSKYTGLVNPFTVDPPETCQFGDRRDHRFGPSPPLGVSFVRAYWHIAERSVDGCEFQSWEKLA